MLESYNAWVIIDAQGTRLTKERNDGQQIALQFRSKARAVIEINRARAHHLLKYAELLETVEHTKQVLDKDHNHDPNLQSVSKQNLTNAIVAANEQKEFLNDFIFRIEPVVVTMQTPAQ